MVFFVNRNVENIDFVVNGVVNIFLLLFAAFLGWSRLNRFQFPQPCFHGIVLFANLVYNLEQFFYFK